MWIALILGACWTGTATPTEAPTQPSSSPPREPVRLRVKLERTACFGTCPAYAVTIHGDGRVEWIGHAHVDAMGRRQGRVSRFELEELSRRLDRAQFFDRNEYGELPAKIECSTTGTAKECSFSTSLAICSDTSHAIITATRDLRVHTIDNDHCNASPELDALEDYIDRIANTDQWIDGR